MGIIASSNTLKRNCRLSKESNFRCPDHRAEASGSKNCKYIFCQPMYICGLSYKDCIWKGMYSAGRITCNMLIYGPCQVKLAAGGNRVPIVVNSYTALVGGIYLGCRNGWVQLFLFPYLFLKSKNSLYIMLIWSILIS